MLNLSQFINKYVFIFNIQIWPNRPGHPTDLPFRSKTLQPKCVKLIMRTGAITKPCTSKPDRNIRKSSFVITGAGVWQEKIKKWKQIYFLWIHIIFINGASLLSTELKTQPRGSQGGYSQIGNLIWELRSDFWPLQQEQKCVIKVYHTYTVL